MGRLVINGEEIYELDEECLKEKYDERIKKNCSLNAEQKNKNMACGQRMRNKNLHRQASKNQTKEKAGDIILCRFKSIKADIPGSDFSGRYMFTVCGIR